MKALTKAFLSRPELAALGVMILGLGAAHAGKAQAMRETAEMTD